MTSPAPATLRAAAEVEASRFPALLARAHHLAGTVLLGGHGRRRPGMGEDFWQYRPVQSGDSLRDVDWRRSGRGDTQFIRQKEWQVAQTVTLWVDPAASLRFASLDDMQTKSDRARLLALATAIVLLRGGERVGLSGQPVPPRSGRGQLDRLTQALLVDVEDDHATPDHRQMPPHSRALFISDFMADPAPVTEAMTRAADRGVRGLLLQVLDPAEVDFPFAGRTIFESMAGQFSHETLRAADLRGRYQARLGERLDVLDGAARACGWHIHRHLTDQPAQSALLWVHHMMQEGLT